MKNHIVKTILILIFSTGLFSVIYAEEKPVEKVILHSGEVYVGEILLRNSELIMLQTLDGSRFQFPLKDVKAVEPATANDIHKQKKTMAGDSETPEPEGNISGLIEMSAGWGGAAGKFDLKPFVLPQLSFGTRLIRGKSLFAGAGAGYLNVFTGDENVGFVPVFLRLRGVADRSKFLPFASVDAGYCFGTSGGYKGGLYARAAAGIQAKAGGTSHFSLGLFGFSTNFSTDLSETTSAGTFSYYGGTNLYGFGISAGLQF
jgi:hypothetical protein